MASDGHFWAAFAVSVLTHALLLTALAVSVGGTRPSFAPQPGLWVQLVDAPRASPAATEVRDRSSLAIRSAVAEAAHPGARIAAMPALEAKRSEPAVPPSRASKVNAEEPPRLLSGHVDVSTTSTLARLGEALAGRSLAEFLPEVEKPVRLASALAVDYPPAALQAKREGSVLAWVEVLSDGSVNEVQIVDGAPEFADSVHEALLKARFLPAEAYGQVVQHYIILQFDFRIGSHRAFAGTEDLGRRPLP